MIDIAHILASDERDDEIRKLLAEPSWKYKYLMKPERSRIIPLDWNLAKQMQAKCPILDFAVAMESVFLATNAITTMTCNHWWRHYAQPYHYILAALVAKENK